MPSGQDEHKQKEIYVEPQVLATYSKVELEESISTQGELEISAQNSI